MVTSTGRPGRSEPGRSEPGGPAARVVLARLSAQAEDLDRRDAQVRRGEVEGVHQARIACRRIRSALATFGPLLDRERTEPLRAEVRWLATGLSDARDTVVVGERLLRLLAEEPPGVVQGPVATRLQQRYAVSAAVPPVLDDERYVVLRRALAALVADPPWTADAARPAREVLPPLVAHDWKRLRRRHEAVASAPDRDVALHETRKAAKRLRYAAEAVRPVVGKDATRLAKRAQELTSYLGERQDTVVSRRQLLELAAAAAEAGEPTFTYGRLHAREEQRAAELDAGLPAVWERVSGPARRWTC